MINWLLTIKAVCIAVLFLIVFPKTMVFLLFVFIGCICVAERYCDVFIEERPVNHPNIFFHGTTHRNALEIYNSNLWLVSDDLDGIWMGDSIDVAQAYAGTDGAIIVLQVLPPLKPVRPSHKPDGYYVLKIPNAKPEKEYYQIPNVRICALLDLNGNKLL